MYPAHKGLSSRRALRRFTSTHTTVVIIGGKSTCKAVPGFPYSSARSDTFSFGMTPGRICRTTRCPIALCPITRALTASYARKPDHLHVGKRRPRAHLAVNVRIKGPMCTSRDQRAHRRAQPASHQARHLAVRLVAHVRGRGSPVGTSESKPSRPRHQPHSPPHAPTTLVHAKGPGLVTFSRTRPGPSRVNEPDYSRKFMPKSMAPSASRKSSDTEPSPKSASE